MLARLNEDQNLLHLGLVGDTYTILVKGGLKVPAQRQHRHIVEACRRGDAVAAIAILERNIRDGFSEIAKHMHELGLGNGTLREEG